MLCACINIKTSAANDIKNLYWYHDGKFHINILVYRYISPIPKLLARLHVWWPINTDIEQTAQICTNCALVARDPARVLLHSWDFPMKPW